MNWFQFMKVDYRLLKSQRAFLVVFPLLAVILGVTSKNVIFIISYLCFGVLIVSATPFLTENKTTSSFVKLLPGSDRGKVAGRYACFLSMLLLFVLCGAALSIVFGRLGYLEIGVLDCYMSVSAVALSLLVGALQILFLYVLGRSKSVQWLSILRMLPTFGFFFLANYVSERVREEPEAFYSALCFVRRNAGALLASGVVLTMLVFVICIYVSAVIVSRRDVE